GLNSVVFNMSRSTGPALAGVLIAMFGTGASYAVQAAFFFLSTLLTSFLTIGRTPPTSPSGHSKRGAFGQSIVEGWRFGWSNQTVRAGLLITMAASLFIIPFTTLLPVFAKDILGVGATGQGFLLTGMGVGALCSAVLIASVGDRLPRGIVMLGGVILYGLSVTAFSISPWFNVSFLLMIVVGLFHVTSHALVQTVIQTHSPTEFRGRVMAIFQQGHFVLTIGAMIYGVLASLWGAQWTVTTMAIVGSLSMVLIYITLPSARRIQ
nr:MFS transporter [Deltaproteobacteria bacterium]